jgi:hypothetical protein
VNAVPPSPPCTDEFEPLSPRIPDSGLPVVEKELEDAELLDVLDDELLLDVDVEVDSRQCESCRCGNVESSGLLVPPVNENVTTDWSETGVAASTDQDPSPLWLIAHVTPSIVTDAAVTPWAGARIQCAPESHGRFVDPVPPHGTSVPSANAVVERMSKAPAAKAVTIPIRLISFLPPSISITQMCSLLLVML